jgi:hypothetical protein
MADKRIFRWLLVLAFIINTITMFVTFYSINEYSCEKAKVEGGYCIYEAVSWKAYMINLGGFPLAVLVQILIWGLVFIIYEKWIKSNWKHSLIFASILLSSVTINLILDIYVLHWISSV